MKTLNRVLPALWVERDGLERIVDHIAPSATWPTWRRMLDDAAELQNAIEFGGISWPGRQQADGAWRRADVHCPATWASLPCVREFVDAIRHAAAEQGVGYGDSDSEPQSRDERPIGEGISLTASKEEIAQNDRVGLGLATGVAEPACAREAWRHYGRRVFVLDPATFGLLARTDLPNVPSEQLTLPLHSFYVVFPFGWRVREAQWDSDTYVEGALVTVDRTDGNAGYERWMRISVHSRGDIAQSVITSVLTYDIALTSDVLLADAANTEPARDEAEEENDLPIPIVFGSDPNVSETIPKVVMNLCLYLASEHPRLEPVPPPKASPIQARSTAKRRKAEQREKRVSRLGYIYVGSKDDAPKGEGATALARHYSLTHQVWVRGHWRLQPHGAGNQLRRMQWIRPHIKGPDFVEAIGIRAARVQPARTKMPTASSDDQAHGTPRSENQ